MVSAANRDFVINYHLCCFGMGWYRITLHVMGAFLVSYIYILSNMRNSVKSNFQSSVSCMCFKFQIDVVLISN